jgi:hypothetical protein
MKYNGVFDNTVMIIMGWFFCSGKESKNYRIDKKNRKFIASIEFLLKI